jgi:hypothetical protein
MQGEVLDRDMSARRDANSHGAEVEAANLLLRDIAELSTLSGQARRDAAARGRWIECSEGHLGAEVTERPLVVEAGVLAIIGRDGRPQDLLGPGRLRAPNATHTLWPLTSTRLLMLPIDLLSVLGNSGTAGFGPASWSASLHRAGTPPGLVVEADLTVDELVRRLDTIGGRAAAVTGMGTPAVLHREIARAAGARHVREVASPAPVVDAEAPVIEVLTSLITSGVATAPLVSAEVPVGAVTLDDLRPPIGPATRAACNRAGLSDEHAMTELAAIGPDVALELLDAGAEASAIARALTAMTVQVLGCAVDTTVAELGPPPARFAWLAFGSLARAEVLPDSDLDTGLAWDDRAGPGAESWFAELATRTATRLRELGYRLDPGGVSADQAPWRRDLAGWREAVRSWTDPTRRHELIGAGIALDARSVAGDLPADEFLHEAILDQLGDSAAMASLAADAVRRPAPRLLARRTGWRSEQARRRLDPKRDLVAPIVDLARIHTLVRGGGEVSTLERLAVSAVEGQVDPTLAVALRDGFDLALRSRLARSVDRAPPVAPAELGPALAPAIRALRTAQRQLRVRHGVSGR